MKLNTSQNSTIAPLNHEHLPFKLDPPMNGISNTISNLLSKTPTIVPIAPNGILL